MNLNRVAQFFRDYSFARFFLPLGIILLVVSFFLFNTIDKNKGFIKTEATVSKVELYEEEYWTGNTHHEATYSITVKYTVDGKEYEEDYGVYPIMKVGDKVSIVYNPADPHDIAQPIGVVWPLACIAGGIACLAASVVSIIRTHAKNKAMKAQEEEWIHG